VAGVVGDAVPLGIGPARHHGDAHGAIFPGTEDQTRRGPRQAIPTTRNDRSAATNGVRSGAKQHRRSRDGDQTPRSSDRQETMRTGARSWSMAPLEG
jgi:hypothetical protein